MDSYMDLLDLLSHILIYLFTVMVSQVLATCAAQIYIYMTFLLLFSQTKLNVLPFICLIRDRFMCIIAKNRV